jgi:heme oxygenase (biliverdin-IX-beta and delta-forming)
MSSSLSRESYVNCLRGFYGFYAPLESALKLSIVPPNNFGDESLLSEAMGSSIQSRLNKVSQLTCDLAYFGVSVAGSPVCSELPPLGTLAELLGCLYVVEGATLGGRIITKHAQETLGIYPATGGYFFQGYGDDTAAMWLGMRRMLVDGASDYIAEDAMVNNAIATFGCLRRWYQFREQFSKQSGD